MCGIETSIMKISKVEYERAEKTYSEMTLDELTVKEDLTIATRFCFLNNP
jgi:hypothetical protein